MSTLALVLVVLAALLLVLFLGGLYANARRRKEQEERFRAQIEAANGALAAAHAEDKGWERAALEQAARDALSEEPAELHLVEVVDRPGIDADQAVFRAILRSGGQETVRLGRREGGWYRVT